jgi:hypothetical protein
MRTSERKDTKRTPPQQKKIERKKKTSNTDPTKKPGWTKVLEEGKTTKVYKYIPYFIFNAIDDRLS